VGLRNRLRLGRKGRKAEDIKVRDRKSRDRDRDRSNSWERGSERERDTQEVRNGDMPPAQSKADLQKQRAKVNIYSPFLSLRTGELVCAGKT
jgi:hypothetical protein